MTTIQIRINYRSFNYGVPFDKEEILPFEFVSLDLVKRNIDFLNIFQKILFLCNQERSNSSYITCVDEELRQTISDTYYIDDATIENCISLRVIPLFIDPKSFAYIKYPFECYMYSKAFIRKIEAINDKGDILYTITIFDDISPNKLIKVL